MGSIAISQGGQPVSAVSIETVDSVVQIRLNDDERVFNLTNSSATVVQVNTPTVKVGREVTLLGNADAAVVFQNNTNTTTRGQLDLGGENIVFGYKDALTLYQKSDGTWRVKSYHRSTSSQTTQTAAISSNDIAIADAPDIILLTNSATTVNTITSTNVQAGRVITIVGSANATATFSNNTGTTTTGQMDLRHADREVRLDSTLTLIQLSTGAWRMVAMSL